MKFPSRPASPSLTALAMTFLIAALCGCASPGPARPPSLHLPNLVTDLTAIRTGDTVSLHWTTPDKTTDGLKVSSTVTAELCRELPKPSSDCTSIQHLTVHPGPSEASEMLTGPLATGPATLLTYRVRLLNAKGHTAGLSAPAFAAAGTAPPLVEDLKVTPIADGAMVEWRKRAPGSTGSVVELDRTLIQAVATAPRKSSKSAKSATSPKSPDKRSLASKPSTPVEVYLRPNALSSDAGGTIDPTVERGDTYRYTAQRVFSVELGGHTLQLRSAPSAAVTAVMKDAFPPKAPTGLAAIPSAGSIDLSWEPNTEPDLAGYIVFRQPVSSTGADAGTSTRLTSAPIQTPAYSDATAQPGQTYTYRVTAVDTAGNESSASNEARESLRNQ
jgi:hypothetical protein